jgi:MSHA pilin protein MshD
MSNRGFTLVEMVIAIVIIGVGLTGVLLAFQTTTRHSADPLINRQMLSLAEGLLEEALSKPYTPQVGTSTGCARDGFNDVDDFNGYAANAACAVNATPSGYALSVSVQAQTVAGVAMKRVIVAVSFGSESLVLSGWRSGYGA